jgi:hypothetical protein
MLEDDSESFGASGFNAKIDDPQLTNALNVSIFPLLTKLEESLTWKNNQRLLKRIKNLEPLPPALTAVTPLALFDEVLGGDADVGATA